MDESVLKNIQEFYKIRPCHVALEIVDLEKLKTLFAAKCEKLSRTRRLTYNSDESSRDSRNNVGSNETSGRRNRYYVCYVCLKKFSSHSQLHAHKAIHDSEENLESVINPVAESSLEIDNTTENISNTVISNENLESSDVNNQYVEGPLGSYVFKCLTCSCYFKTGFNLFVHIRENKGKACKFHCDRCNKMFKYPIEFSQHIARHLGNSLRRKRKPDNKVDSKLDYKIDVLDNQSIPNSLNTLKPPGQYNCVLCSKTCEDCFQLKRHLILGHKIKESEITILLNDQVKKRTNTPNIELPGSPIEHSAEKVSEFPTSDDGTVSENVDGTDGTVSENVDGTVSENVDGTVSENVTDDKFTCNMCFDEFSNKQELEDHISLHLELNMPKDKTGEKSTCASISSSNEVIVIDDDEEEALTNQPTETEKLKKMGKPKRKIKLKEVKVFTPSGNSLLKTSLLRNKAHPFILTGTGFQLVRPIAPKNVGSQQQTQMVLLSSPPQESKNVKLLKTGPQSFQLCFDGVQSNPPSVSTNLNIASSSNNSNIQNNIPVGNIISLSNATQMSHIPLINMQSKPSSSDIVTTHSPSLITTNVIPVTIANTSFCNSVPKMNKCIKKLVNTTEPISSVKDIASTSYTPKTLPALHTKDLIVPTTSNITNIIDTIHSSTSSEAPSIREIDHMEVVSSSPSCDTRTQHSRSTTLNNKTINIRKNCDPVAVNSIEANCSEVMGKDSEICINSLASNDTSNSNSILNYKVGITEHKPASDENTPENASSDLNIHVDAAVESTPSSSDVISNINITNIVSIDHDATELGSASSDAKTSNDLIAGVPDANSTDDSESNNVDTGNESDDLGLIIDEETTHNDNSSVVSSENTCGDNIPTEKPKIFVRKLCDLMDPQKLEKVEAEEKRKKLKEKKCNDCNLVFAKMRTLTRHMRKKISCIKCDYRNCRVHQMKTHYQTKHDLFLCVRCKKIAENGYELYKHTAEVHTCSVCQHTVTDLEVHKNKCAGPKEK